MSLEQEDESMQDLLDKISGIVKSIITNSNQGGKLGEGRLSEPTQRLINNISDEELKKEGVEFINKFGQLNGNLEDIEEYRDWLRRVAETDDEGQLRVQFDSKVQFQKRNQ